MTESLQTRSVEKVPDRMRFEGRILFLTEDPVLIQRQLAGEDLPFDPAAPVGTASRPKLRDNISTDEITPAYICYYFDETHGEYPYLGLKAGEEFPIVRGSVKSINWRQTSAASAKRRSRRNRIPNRQSASARVNGFDEVAALR